MREEPAGVPAAVSGHVYDSEERNEQPVVLFDLGCIPSDAVRNERPHLLLYSYQILHVRCSSRYRVTIISIQYHVSTVCSR